MLNGWSVVRSWRWDHSEIFLAVWNQLLHQLSGWRVCRWRTRCGAPWTGIGTRGLPLWGWLDVLANSLKQQRRWLRVMKEHLFNDILEYGDQPRAHLCIILLFSQYLEYIKSQLPSVKDESKPTGVFYFYDWFGNLFIIIGLAYAHALLAKKSHPKIRKHRLWWNPGGRTKKATPGNYSISGLSCPPSSSWSGLE